MQRSGEHNGVRLCSDAPIVGSFELNGRTISTLCRRNLHDAIRDMKLLVEILPQNSITNQEVKHASVDTSRGPVVVSVGDGYRAGSVAAGVEVGR